MKAIALPLLLLIFTGSSIGADQTQISASELTLGGVAIGQSELEVTRLHGPPQTREDTGEGFRLRYPGLDVYVGVKGYGVFDILSTNSTQCTPSKVCPGMPVAVANRAYGTPVVAKREHGTFLEYIPKGSTCWLQLSTPQGVIRSLRVACQP